MSEGMMNIGRNVLNGGLVLVVLIQEALRG